GHPRPRLPAAGVIVSNRTDPDSPPLTLPGPWAAGISLTFLDPTTLVAAGGEVGGPGLLRVYDFPSGQLLGQLTGHRGWAQNLAATPDGTRLVSTSWATADAGELRLWDARGFRPAATVKMPGESSYVSDGAVSPDGKLLVLGGWNSKGLAAW